MIVPYPAAAADCSIFVTLFVESSSRSCRPTALPHFSTLAEQNRWFFLAFDLIPDRLDSRIAEETDFAVVWIAAFGGDDDRWESGKSVTRTDRSITERSTGWWVGVK
jgi:hypothetical protein